VRIEKFLCAVLHEGHRRQVEETMEALADRPEGLYKTSRRCDTAGHPLARHLSQLV
jgi:hypothetical protein